MEKMVLSVSTDSAYDLQNDCWTLLEDVPIIGTPTLELVPFLRDGEKFVKGEIMVSRAKELGNMAGQRHADQMLAQASRIPESWQDFAFVFPGTIWRDLRGRHHVPYLDQYSDGLELDWYCLGNIWGRAFRLVRVS